MLGQRTAQTDVAEGQGATSGRKRPTAFPNASVYTHAHSGLMGAVALVPSLGMDGTPINGGLALSLARVQSLQSIHALAMMPGM